MSKAVTTRPLGQIARVINGRAYKQEELLNYGKYRVLRVGNFFSNGSWYYSDLELEHDKYCEQGDLLFAWSASFGPKIWDQEKVIYHYHIWKIVEDRKVLDRGYLYYYLLNSVKGMMASTHGSIMLHLTKDFMDRLPVHFPSDLKSQARISSVLTLIDKKIDCNNHINSELEMMAKTLFDYWFVQFDFPDTNGKPYKSSGGKMVYNSILKREIPVGWDVLNLNDLVDLIKGNVSPSDVAENTPYIGLEHIGRKTIVLSEWASSDFAESDKTVFKKNDILFGKIRPYFHKVTVAPFDGITSTDTIILRPKKRCNFGLALETVFADEFVEAATQSSTGSKMPRADWNVLQHYKIPVPDTTLLHSFNAVFEKALDKIFLSETENKQLVELRDWLLPMLMNGQVTVA